MCCCCQCCVDAPTFRVVSLSRTGSLKLTPLRTAIVPPPMAYCTLQLPEPIQEVTFDPIQAVACHQHAAALLADGSICVLSLRLAMPRDRAADGGASACTWATVTPRQLHERGLDPAYVSRMC